MTIYCLLALAGSAVFLPVASLSHDGAFGGYDWASVPAQARPSLWFATLSPAWLFLAILAVTIPAAVGCFMRGRGQGGRGLLLLYALATMLVCLLHLGVRIHLWHLGPVATGPGSSVQFTEGDVLYSLVQCVFLLAPVIAVLVAMRTGDAKMKRRTRPKCCG